MQIEKLEKLSCLKISESAKQKISASLDGIIVLLEEVQDITLPLLEIPSYSDTIFRSSNTACEDKTSLHLEEGLFLAPKVIKKD